MLGDYLALVAIVLSIISLVSVHRGVTRQAKAEALRQVEAEVKELNARLEEEVRKLQKGLDLMIKERIGLKEEITALRNALAKAHIEVEELIEELKEDV